MAEKIIAACNNSRLACLSIMSGAVLVVLGVFWAAQTSTLSGMDARLRTVEMRQSAVMANLDTVIGNQAILQAELGTVQTTQAKMEGKLDMLLSGVKRLEDAKDPRRASDGTP